MGRARGAGSKSGVASTAVKPNSKAAVRQSIATLACLLDVKNDCRVLQASELVPSQPGLLVTVDGLLTPAECEAFVATMEGREVMPAAPAVVLHPPTTTDLRPRKNEALLVRDAAAVVDLPLAERLWARLRPVLPDVVVGDDQRRRVPVALVGDRDATVGKFKLYRYTKGHQFGLHVDVSSRGVHPGEETEYTLLVYLNSAGQPVPPHQPQPLAGGDTVFMATAKTELCRVSPTAGTALLHAHGRRCLLHAGEEVTRGVKYLLRADVLFAPAG